jgi:pimeloyl-ACP methyl ester carboxylesterase
LIDRFVTRAGLRLHVIDHGGAGPSVLLLHGGSAHARWWDFVVPHLGPRLHVYALDLRGHGESAWASDGAYRVADYASDVAHVIEALGLEKPALAGHSLGSFVALRYAVEHPRSLSALVVVDGRASLGAASTRYMRLLAMLGPASYATLDDAVASFRPLPQETIATPTVLAHVARHGMHREHGRWTTRFDRRSLGAHEAFDLRDRLRDLECPVLFVRGEHSTVVSRTALAKLSAACRRGESVEIPGAFHHLLIDRPDRLGAEIRRFLDHALRSTRSPAGAARVGKR